MVRFWSSANLLRPKFIWVYSSGNEKQHCWEGTCDGLASHPGGSMHLHTKLLAQWKPDLSTGHMSLRESLRQTAWGMILPTRWLTLYVYYVSKIIRVNYSEKVHKFGDLYESWPKHVPSPRCGGVTPGGATSLTSSFALRSTSSLSRRCSWSCCCRILSTASSRAWILWTLECLRHGYKTSQATICLSENFKYH